MVPPTESLRFVAGELGKCGRNLEEIGAKFLGPNRFGVFFKTWRNAYLYVHELGHIGKLEANLDSFKTHFAARFDFEILRCFRNNHASIYPGKREISKFRGFRL